MLSEGAVLLQQRDVGVGLAKTRSSGFVAQRTELNSLSITSSQLE